MKKSINLSTIKNRELLLMTILPVIHAMASYKVIGFIALETALSMKIGEESYSFLVKVSALSLLTVIFSKYMEELKLK